MQFRTTVLARGLALSWAAFWLFFIVVESLAWHTPLLLMAAWTGIGLLFVAAAALAWRRPHAGGVLLMAIGAVAGPAYAVWPPERLPIAARVLTVAVLAGPPLAAGLLLLRNRASRPA